MIQDIAKKVLVSVIVPAYNVEDYIGRCIESLVTQSLDNIEILIVNDGSTDNTQEIIDCYREAYPDKIRTFSQKNAGPSKARNLALSVARGDYIAFVDSDDQIAPEMLKKMYHRAIAYDADLVLCGRAYNDEAGTITSTWFPKEINGYTNIFQTPKILSDTSSFLWDKLFKRETLQNHNFLFDESIHYAEDALFVYKFLYYASKVCSVQEALYYYTVRRPGSITGAVDSRMMHEIEACRALTKFYVQVGAFTLFQDYLLWICIGFWGRKFYRFCEYPGSNKIKYDFVCGFYDLLEEFYPKWKMFLRKYATKGNRRKQIINYYKTNRSLVKVYIYTPGWLIRAVRWLRQVPPKGKKAFRSIKNKMPSKKEKYFTDYLIARSTMPINDKCLLYISNSGDNLAGNPFYLAQNAARRKGYTIYMGSKNPARDSRILQRMDLDIILVKMDSPQFQVILATAKYLVTNYRFPTYFCKREGQIVMNTWHGTPLKCLGKHMNNGLRDLGNVQSQFLACNFLLYPNEYTREKMFDAFQLDKLYHQEVLVTGYPCNSIFFDRGYEKSLRAELGLQKKKVVVYMPTWRGQSTASMDRSYQSTMNEILLEIDGKLDDETIFFVKMHNLAAQKVKLAGYKHIRPFPDNLEIYCFLNIADILITDYSSVFFDFANSKKEIILFTYDEEEYVNERGMYLHLSEIPFKRVQTVDALIKHLNSWNGDRSTPLSAYDDFCAHFCALDSRLTGQNVNDIFLADKGAPKISPNRYTVCFAPELSNSGLVEACQELIANNDDMLFAFSICSITPYMDQLLKSVEFSHMNYVIVQNENIFTRGEEKEIAKGERTGKWSKSAREALLREKDRILPGISIKNIINLTTDPFFCNLTALFNVENGCNDK